MLPPLLIKTARSILLFTLFWSILSLQFSRAQKVNDSSALFRIIPRTQVEALIRNQFRAKLEAKKIESPVIDARFSLLIPAITDSLVSFLKYQPEIERITNGDTLLLKKLQRTAGQKKWERNILEMCGKLVENGEMLWPMLFSRDYSDRILVFHSDIRVLPSSKLMVEETIVVYNGNGEKSPDIDYNTTYDPNDDIQRGIVRDFPTRYRGKNGLWESVGFELLGVTKNGQTANYHTESLDNGTRILVGDESVILGPGIYTYRFLYQTDRQIISHPEKDELYWNVNGTGWVFYADSVSATIHFPSGARISENDCYTGVQGSTDQFCSSTLLNDSTIHFRNTTRLEPWQGLTVAAAIQKGILTPPPPRNFMAIGRDNFGIPVLLAVLLFLLTFYLLAWFARGRDPKKGVIYPQFEPPAGLTPADVGYISEQHYGSHLFAAALIDMAVHKHLEIEVVTEKLIFKLTRYQFNAPAGLPKAGGERFLKQYGFYPSGLYGQTAERGKYNPTLKTCYDALGKTLDERFRIRRGKTNAWKGLFVRNDGFTAVGGILCFLALGFGVIFLANEYTPVILAITLPLMVALLTVQIVFTKIMSAYTGEGRQIADHIEGFKMYLETAEQKLFEFLTPPEKTLDLFEKYLPYAIALKVENEWAEKFDSIMQKALEQGYQPVYYYRSEALGHGFSISQMSRGISSGLSSTVASAATPPSSSSGGW